LIDRIIEKRGFSAEGAWIYFQNSFLSIRFIAIPPGPFEGKIEGLSSGSGDFNRHQGRPFYWHKMTFGADTGDKLK